MSYIENHMRSHHGLGHRDATVGALVTEETLRRVHDSDHASGVHELTHGIVHSHEILQHDDPRNPSYYDLDVFQDEVRAWSQRNFGEGNSMGFGPIAGVSEEYGELAEMLDAQAAALGVAGAIGRLQHAHLKGHQSVRHTPEEIIDKKKDAIGDILVYLADYTGREGFRLTDCAQRAWAEVRERDWIADPMGGKAKED